MPERVLLSMTSEPSGSSRPRWPRLTYSDEPGRGGDHDDGDVGLQQGVARARRPGRRPSSSVLASCSAVTACSSACVLRGRRSRSARWSADRTSPTTTDSRAAPTRSTAADAGSAPARASSGAAEGDGGEPQRGARRLGHAGVQGGERPEEQVVRRRPAQAPSAPPMQQLRPTRAGTTVAHRGIRVHGSSSSTTTVARATTMVAHTRGRVDVRRAGSRPCRPW